MRKKYTLITGTRPQIIKSVPIIRAAESTSEIKLIHIFTGQHYDSYLADIFFQTLEIEYPKYQLDVRSGSTDYHIRMILDKLVPLLKKTNTTGLLVPGDTNSALAAGLAGMFLSIPVMHIEAGLRSYDFKMQEEINRRLIDHGSSVLFAPTRTAVDNLKKESVLGKIVFSGDTMYDLLLAEKEKIMDKLLFNKAIKKFNIVEKDYSVLTVHRRENVTNIEKLKRIITTIGGTNIKTIFPIHPNTRKTIEKSNIRISNNIQLIDPISYQKFLNLVAFSGLVITDSGGLQKEAYLLNIPCVTLRNSTEWVETVTQKANKVVGTNPDLILQAISELFNKKLETDNTVYGNGQAAENIVKELVEDLPVVPTVTDLLNQ
ncbi:MAG: non-hydrolyzing UDP-N-acetylglucosamine 2-epimerase [Candidatus Hodarchaeota archaeon]